MITHSLVLQSDYNNVSIALCKDSSILETSTDTKHNASKNLVTQMNTLLANHNLEWADLNFIGLNQGPAPFTTLRVIITTANGLNFAQKLPLVGVDGIKTFLQEQQHTTSVTVVLLNAFAKDLYFGIKENNKIIATGWENNQILFESLHKDYPNTPITFVGNGVPLFEKELKEVFGDWAQISDPLPHYCSLESIINQAFTQWEQKENIHDTLLPMYLKTLKYKTFM
ncbi:MAG: tRNA threonylcarbamoyl adenosine modification protein YeaZ [Alteromonas naphthalenivorans]|jgi:tRNA threonylcarbamoyl adenosine modification protein YeaZ